MVNSGGQARSISNPCRYDLVGKHSRLNYTGFQCPTSIYSTRERLLGIWVKRKKYDHSFSVEKPGQNTKHGIKLQPASCSRPHMAEVWIHAHTVCIHAWTFMHICILTSAFSLLTLLSAPCLLFKDPVQWPHFPAVCYAPFCV